MSNSESIHEFAARMGAFTKNRAAFPEDELMKYAGQWVAWSPDGTAVVASSAESDLAVYEILKSKGYDFSQCLVTFVDNGDVGELGAALMFVKEIDGAEAEPER